MLVGPIKAWWDEFGSPRHEEFANWRKLLSDALVEHGHLVYRPHEAWKGEWEKNGGEHAAQLVNDAAILAADVIINMTPPGVPSKGTDDEAAYAARYGKVMVPAPPPTTALVAAAHAYAKYLPDLYDQYRSAP